MKVKFKATPDGEVAIMPRAEYERLKAFEQEAEEDAGTARLIARAAENSQLIVVSHAPELIRELMKQRVCHSIRLEKHFGETTILDTTTCQIPVWHWSGR